MKSDGAIAVSVAICTWNRARVLDQTLAQMHALKIPDGLKWELLVVDNNSTDDTDAVAAKHAAALPLVLLHEPKQGHSHARNCAVEQARGELILWTDDDVLVDPLWLSEYVKAAAAFPEAGFFGGTVEPWFESEPPAWVLKNLPELEGPFALRRLGPDVRPLGEREQVFGASMAFRTALLKSERFDPALGRVGTAMVSGDDTELVKNLRRAGHRGVWVGTARVKHFVPSERMRAGYIWKFFHGLGRTKQRLVPHDRGVPLFLNVPRWVVREYLAERVRSVLFAPGRGARWLRSFTKAAVARGIIDECRMKRRAAWNSP